MKKSEYIKNLKKLLDKLTTEGKGFMIVYNGSDNSSDIFATGMCKDCLLKTIMLIVEQADKRGLFTEGEGTEH